MHDVIICRIRRVQVEKLPCNFYESMLLLLSASVILYYRYLLFVYYLSCSLLIIYQNSLKFGCFSTSVYFVLYHHMTVKQRLGLSMQHVATLSIKNSDKPYFIVAL